MSTCADCNQIAEGTLRRSRCRACYRQHLKRLKAEGKVSSRAGRPRKPAAARLLERIEKAASGCWIYSRQLSDQGYPRITDDVGQTVHAHRVSYEVFVGPIPAGFQVDHECHNRDVDCPGGKTCCHRRCVNPQHLRAVTSAENTLSGKTLAARNAATTHCPQGHAYTPENTRRRKNGGRECKACQRSRQAAPRPKAGLTPAMTHGKRSTYTRGGCRCDLCKAAESAHASAKRKSS